MIRDQRRHANAQVHVEPIAQLARNPVHDALALLDVFSRLWYCVQPMTAFLTVRFSIRLSNNSPRKIRFTYTECVCTKSPPNSPSSTKFSTSSIVTFAAVAMMGLKFRAVFR